MKDNLLDKAEDFTALAFSSLKRRKLRAWLTMLGIFISIATIFFLVSISLGLDNAVQEQFRQFGTDKFFVEARGQLAGPVTQGAAIVTEDDVRVLEKISGVKGVSYWSAGNAKIEFKDNIRYVLAIGFPLDQSNVFLENGFYKIDKGKFLQTGDRGKVMLGSQYANLDWLSQPVETGDTITINDQDFKVRTILKTVGNAHDDRLILMPLEDFRELFPEKGESLGQIIVQIEPGSKMQDVVPKAEKKLRSSRDVTEKTQDFRILTPEEILAIFGTILNILTGFLLGIAAISLIVGGIGIANTMYTSVLERRKEIGVMKAVGAQNKDILSLFVIESGLLGLVGGLAGVFLGFLLGKAVEFIATNQLGTTILQASTPHWLVIGCLAFSFLTGAVSGLFPAWQAVSIKPVEALRYE